MIQLVNFSHISQALGWTIVHVLWQGATIALAVGLVLRWAGALSCQARYTVAYAGLVLTCLLATGTFAWHVRQPSRQNQPAPSFSVVLTEVQTPHPVAKAAPAPLGAKQHLEQFIQRHHAHIVQFWGLGVLFFLLRGAGGMAYAHRLRVRGTKAVSAELQQAVNNLAARMGLHRPVRVLESALLQTPAVIGWLKPVLLLPLGMVCRLSPSQLEAVLIHELAHIHRHDYLLNLVQTLIEALFYFHPAVWYLSGLVRREREHCCDDVVLRLNAHPLDYAKALLWLQENALVRAPRMAVALGKSQGALLLRIRRILNFPSHSSPSKSSLMEKNILLGLLLAIATAVGLHAAHLAPSHRMNLKTSSAMALDSLPPGKFRITTIERGDSLEVRAENRKITFLRINDRIIPEAEYPKYERRILQIIQPEPPMPPVPPVPPVPPIPPAPGEVHAHPAPPRLLEKSVIIEFDEMLPSDPRVAASDTAKGISRMRIYAPELTIVHGKDTIVIVGTDAEQPKSHKIRQGTVTEDEFVLIADKPIQGEKGFQDLKTQQQQLAREQQELARELQRSAREMQRSAKEMQRSARDMQRLAKETERSTRETQKER